MTSPSSPNKTLAKRYNLISHLYDILDYPWELRYRRWRPKLVGDVHGNILEIGVGTGHNLRYYPADADVTAIDISESMLKRAKNRAKGAACHIRFLKCDATQMENIPSNHYDWVIATFVFCVMPNALQQNAFAELERVLKPGGRFRIMTIVYSKNARLRKRQTRWAKLVELLYGARFDRNSQEHIERNPHLIIERISYMKDDTYLLIEGQCETSVTTR